MMTRIEKAASLVLGIVTFCFLLVFAQQNRFNNELLRDIEKYHEQLIGKTVDLARMESRVEELSLELEGKLARFEVDALTPKEVSASRRKK